MNRWDAEAVRSAEDQSRDLERQVDRLWSALDAIHEIAYDSRRSDDQMNDVRHIIRTALGR